MSNEKEFAKPVFKKKRLLTRSLLKILPETEYHLKITSAFFVGTNKAKPGDTDIVKQPPTLAHVLSLDDGKEYQIIVPTVLKTELQDQYEGDGYVGKCFEIVGHAPSGKKAYWLFDLAEIEDPEESAGTPAPKVDAPKVKR